MATLTPQQREELINYGVAGRGKWSGGIIRDGLSRLSDDELLAQAPVWYQRSFEDGGLESQIPGLRDLSEVAGGLGKLGGLAGAAGAAYLGGSALLGAGGAAAPAAAPAAGGISAADAALAMGSGLEGAAGAGVWGGTGAGVYSGLEGLTAVDLGLETLPFTTDPSLASLGGDTAFWSGAPIGGETFRDPWDMLPNNDIVYQNPEVLDLPLPNGGVTGGGGTWLDTLKQYGGQALNAAKGLFGPNASGGGTGILPSGSPFDVALATAPALAAISYARNQGPFDTSRLTSTYDQFEPSALAYEYDQNTAAQRRGLESSLTNRGVMGSSFANQDFTNLQTSRDLGRRSLLNQGFAQRASIAKDILNAQVQDRALKNQLYGSALYSLGNIFGGSRR